MWNVALAASLVGSPFWFQDRNEEKYTLLEPTSNVCNYSSKEDRDYIIFCESTL